MQKKLLLLICLFSLMLTIYHLWATVPDIADYASDAYLFQEPPEGRVWADWVLEAREMFWDALIGSILHICFYVSIALWSLFTIIGRTKVSFEKETSNET
jgi:hypothetical protein